MTDFQKVYWLDPANGFCRARNISNGDNQACLPYSGSVESVSNVRMIKRGRRADRSVSWIRKN
jgi:hypothetical protein